MTTGPFPPERRHTLYFLEEIRGFAPVSLDTEVDMTAVRALGKYSPVACTIYVAGRVLVRHPDANAAIRGRVRPRIAWFDAAHAKVALDKTVNGRRVVLSAVLACCDRSSLDDIRDRLAYLRDGDPEVLPALAAVRPLRQLPMPLGRFGFRRVVRPLRNRPERFGTFAVTSLGHRSVDGFYSVGGTTVTLGVGRVADRPVVRGGAVGTAPVMRLSLTFDHRVIDGAEAADVLTEIKDDLENLRLEAPQAGAGASATGAAR